MTQPFALSIKVIIRDSAGRCLLIRRSGSSKNNAGRWDFPGGKVDAGEAFDRALIREVGEETGLDIEITALVGSAQSQAPGRMVVYLIMEGRQLGGQLRLSEEHSGYEWVEPDGLPRCDLCPQFREVALRYAQAAATSMP